MWGNPPEVGNVLGAAAFDVVLDNNGKDLDAVKFVLFSFSLTKLSQIVIYLNV